MLGSEPLTPLPVGGLPPSVAPSLRRNVSLDEDDEEEEADREVDGVVDGVVAGVVDGDERKERIERRPERTFDLGSAAAPRSPNVATEDGPGTPLDGWDGAVVAVLGLFDKGKTFVLNHLTDSRLPSGKKVIACRLHADYMLSAYAECILSAC